MTLNQLVYFTVAAKELHFGRAAKELCISQPSLSIALAHLEDELGLALFEKSGRGVALTDAGRALQSRAARILEQVDDAPDSLGRRAVEREGEALLRRIRPGDHVVALCVEARAPDSPGLAALVDGWERRGARTVLVIGGSNGLSEAVLARADERLSFSNLTFPHGLMRVILLEQLYRAERIRAGEPYHK